MTVAQEQTVAAGVIKRSKTEITKTPMPKTVLMEMMTLIVMMMVVSMMVILDQRRAALECSPVRGVILGVNSRVLWVVVTGIIYDKISCAVQLPPPSASKAR